MAEIYTVTFPDIGEGVVEGEIVQWLKRVGETVKQDEPVVIVMTDKATVELPSPYPGMLTKQHYKPGEIAVKDHPLYDIETDAAVTRKEPVKLPQEAEVKKEEAPPRPEGKVQAAPTVRRLAKDLGIDIQTIHGTGKEGRVIAEDLKRTEHSDAEVRPLIGIRQLMAKKMAESKKNIPHFSYFEQAEATRLVHMREKFKIKGEKENIHVTFMPFLIKALSLTIQKFPEINSHFDMGGNQLIVHHPHNIGIAVSTSLGLIVPVLKNVEKKGIEELIKDYEELKRKAGSNQLAPSDMKGATISLSNFGVAGGGGLWATPIINSPETAILAVARIQKLPFVKDDQVVARDVLNLSWSFDHRVIDGDTASQISHYYAGLIQHPAKLI